MRRAERSRAVFSAGRAYMPGGVNSPVRSFRGVGGDPVVVASGAGSHIVDVDGKEDWIALQRSGLLDTWV